MRGPDTSWDTGADVRQVAEFRLPSGEPAILVVAGSALHALTWDGRTLFRDSTRVVTRVLHVADTPTGPVALVLSREDRVDLVDLQTGRCGWHYDGPEGTRLSGAGSSRLVREAGALAWIVAPTYGEAILCFEVVSVHEVRTRWVRDFAGRYDRGFGPAMIVADVLGSGRPQLVISSRTGSAYEHAGDGPDVPTEKVVLGRADGHLYQAVLDLTDGRIVGEVAYRPDPGDYPCARPYGLIQAVTDGTERLVVQVSCQVEEFYSVTRVSSSMQRAWGEFVEKDWPVDDQELRPQLTSLVETDGREPVLVVGHYDKSTWRTLVRSAATGSVLAQLDDHYFWGTVPGAVEPIAVVSPATDRRLTGDEGLAAYRLTSLEPVCSAPDLRPLTCGTNELPADITFHADRRSIVTLTCDGVVGVLATRSGRLVWWAPAEDRIVDIADMDATEAYPGIDGAVVVVEAGHLHRVSADLRVAASVSPHGRRPEALPTIVRGAPWTIATIAGDRTLVAGDEAQWYLDGAAAAVVSRGDAALVATILGSGSVALWHCAGELSSPVGRITPVGPASHVRFIRGDRVLVVERTGVHTAAASVYGLDGRLVWRDAAHGAHPNLPMAAPDSTGRWLVAYDDHGVLVLRDADTGELLAERDWTAAYTTPVLHSADGTDLLLRVGGVHGMECLELVHGAGGSLGLRERWRRSAALWRYFPGDAAVARHDDGGTVGALSPTGELDLVDLADGHLHRTVDTGPLAVRPPIVALDVDGNGTDEFVLGTADGRLLTVAPTHGAVREWPMRFEAAVETLTVAAGAAATALLVGTADGRLHRVRI